MTCMLCPHQCQNQTYALASDNDDDDDEEDVTFLILMSVNGTVNAVYVKHCWF